MRHSCDDATLPRVKPALVIIGLGNPGAAYERTRHNAGFWGMDALSKAFGAGKWEEKQKFLCLQQEARIVMVPVLLVKPATFMNSSGECVQKIIDFWKLDASQQLLVLSDDIDLPLGELRLRMKGGPGTHNGLRSITLRIGEGYPRIRIGIGLGAKQGDDLATWVLSIPPPEEEKIIRTSLETLPERLKNFVLEQQKEE
jgi:PTH1 family peptidyl-tRNA hydrolase